MDLQLNAKRALVTGSASGIGEGIVRALAREGAHVIVHSREEAKASRVAQDIRSDGGKAAIAVGDLADDDGAKSVAQQAADPFGGIDILVNNAGSKDPSVGWMEASTDKWVDTYQVGVLAAVRLIRHLTPGMDERGWGRIIQVSSVVGVRPPSLAPEFSAAKAALNNLAGGLAKELAYSGITVNTVSPGPTLTPDIEQAIFKLAEKRGWDGDWEDVEKRTTAATMPNPVGRLGRIEEIADLVVFVSSPLAGYINGANLLIDGGYAVTAS